MAANVSDGEEEFQSTLSVRRATRAMAGMMAVIAISIHALREESDATAGLPWRYARHFNPRSP